MLHTKIESEIHDTVNRLKEDYVLNKVRLNFSITQKDDSCVNNNVKIWLNYLSDIRHAINIFQLKSHRMMIEEKEYFIHVSNDEWLTIEKQLINSHKNVSSNHLSHKAQLKERLA